MTHLDLVLEVICTRRKAVLDATVGVSFVTSESHNHFITANHDRSTRGKDRHCTETTTTEIARYHWLKHCATTKPHAKLKGERS